MEQVLAEVPRVEKKGKGRMVGILVALVLVLSAGAAGAVFAPRLLAKAPAASSESDAEETAAEEGHEDAAADREAAPARKSRKSAADPVGEVTELSPIVVDLRASDGSVRHLKIQLAIELQAAEKEDEFKRYIPFAREAAIAYLRTQDYDRLSDPKSFEAVRQEIGTEVIEAVGKKHAKRVLITDFVGQ